MATTTFARSSRLGRRICRTSAQTPCALTKTYSVYGAVTRGWWTLAPRPWNSRTNATSTAAECRG